jgi:hypothetical protein
MPYSYGKFKQEVKEKIISCISAESKILDVGAGSGCYVEMLYGKFSKIDALEIFPKYIEIFNLHTKYDKVIEGNILQFDFYGYDFLIMGDVLEHLSANDAQLLLSKVEDDGKSVLVAVPYLYEQGEEFGNVHETHLQPDLTPELMAERYPQLTLLYGDSNYGYYVNAQFYKGCNQQ